MHSVFEWMVRDNPCYDPNRIGAVSQAKVLAALNHPNIAQIYGMEENALIMELVEGEHLTGPLDVPTTVKYARRIADEEDAREVGVVGDGCEGGIDGFCHGSGGRFFGVSGGER